MSDTGIVRIHGKEYQTVGKRINDFRANYPEYEISTEVLSAAELILVKATIKNSQGQVIATGHAEEERGSTNINRTSAVENAETSAVGRCLAFMGLGGTQIASADEVVNAQNQLAVKDIYARMTSFTRAFAFNFSSVEAIKTYLSNDEIDLAKEAWNEIPHQDQMDLWLAVTKGGCFTTEERRLLKES
jgi:hypothetical protein